MFKIHALFGGTFDPIHYGHLLTVESITRKIRIKKITFLPNNIPPHKPQPQATIKQRIEMLKIAISCYPLFEIDMRERLRTTPSWTILNLETFRAEYGTKQPLGFIIGQDSFLTLSNWYRWHELLTFCHLIVCQRPSFYKTMVMNTSKMQKWLNKHLVDDIQKLYYKPAGYIWLAKTPFLNISATKIRWYCHKGISCVNLLPDVVINYINYFNLYRNL